NNKIFALTNQGQYSVRFDMTDDNGTSAFAEYKVFWIENEANKYKLHMSKYSGNSEYISVWKFRDGVAAQVLTLSSDFGSKFRGPSKIALMLL
ncbi:hypothetical protein AVEN_181825-1, partial [Araneus ventricosus]